MWSVPWGPREHAHLYIGYFRDSARQPTKAELGGKEPERGRAATKGVKRRVPQKGANVYFCDSCVAALQDRRQNRRSAVSAQIAASILRERYALAVNLQRRL